MHRNQGDIGVVVRQDTEHFIRKGLADAGDRFEVPLHQARE